MTEPFIIGDTFAFTGPVSIKINGVLQTDLTGWTAASQLRSPDGGLIADLAIEWLSYAPPAIAVTFEGSTREWPDCDALMDIEFQDPAGRFKSTRAAVVPLRNDVTRSSAYA